MTKGNSTGFFIHDFMIDSLALSGVSLTVYALIYSFAASGADCHGSIEYIAARVGSSQSTVKRVLADLCSRQLIIKQSDPKMRTKAYKINRAILAGNYVSEIQNEPVQNELPPDSFSAFEGFKMSYNNKEIINTSTTTSSTDLPQKQDTNFLSFGAERLTMMTMEQYLDLKKKLGKEALEYYIARIEGTLISCPEMYLKNHYKTILKWARDDARLE